MPKGFTLIELLIVVTIIAVLSVIGAVIYGNVQRGARDAKRVSDINAIASALEAKKSPTSAGYGNVLPAYFSDGALPYDPKAPSALVVGQVGCGSGSGGYTNACWYCYNNSNSATQRTTPGNCAASDGYVGDVNWGTAPTRWMICANLEATINGATYYCKSNAQ